MTARRRTLFPWPAWSDASTQVVELVRRSEDWLARISPAGAAQVMTWLHDDPLAAGQTYPPELGLTHRLAPWFHPGSDGPARQGRSLREWAILDRFGARLTDTIETGCADDFVRGLATLASHGLQRPIQPRNRDIGTGRDPRGDRVIFPSSALIRERLALVHRELGATQSPWLYRAGLGMAAISNCHPFDDGNGRTSRMVFNALVRRGTGRSDLYVPLHELAVLSGGSLTLAVREAELQGRWEPLFGFLEGCLALVARGAPRPQAFDGLDRRSLQARVRPDSEWAGAGPSTGSKPSAGG
ncbi:hypothetical protein J2800_002959 [Caulobacter rhizosphaerae]|jgi:hypothetical protein|uniref:Fido domain-containing protein n=1 Tax=Caulobacter rhizosphaerae TaxID=2010972 RepID=A0ABU1N188_9CAUL|nr:Fic family protein [Caulobacter rhizosphaerae]MDR6532203.1 hypothetical protein [Caulobacter rhizosphaerae]